MKRCSFNFNQGLTLVEMLVIIVIFGILSAIATPSWLAFLKRQRLNAAQAEALAVMRQAQINAKAEKRIWQASFRKYNDRVQWALHPANLATENLNWNDLLGEDADQIDIDQDNTTLLRRDRIYRVQFQYKGRVNGQLGRITLISGGSTNSSNAPRRCVWVSTLLGALRTDQNRSCLRD